MQICRPWADADGMQIHDVSDNKPPRPRSSTYHIISLPYGCILFSLASVPCPCHPPLHLCIIHPYLAARSRDESFVPVSSATSDGPDDWISWPYRRRLNALVTAA